MTRILGIAMRLSCLLLATVIPAQARPPAPTGLTVRGDRPSHAFGEPLTAQDLQAWLDGYMPYALASAAIPGAVVVVVKDGRVLFEHGYGVSDTTTGAPVDPGRTLFRVGSVSKLVTWTAVMQLAEAGRIDLDADVNTYLDFAIPPFQGQPITLRNIMTHTAGFEEAHRGIATLDARDMPSLGDSLRHWIPARVYAPGTTPAYSNYAAALAGYMVQRVSREPFDRYVACHIFGPLGMRHSTFAEPLPPTLRLDMSKGYPSAGAPAQPFELVLWKPAGAMSATGEDMARFMIAHLQDGELDGSRILLPATARAMHTTALTLLPPLNRMELGFFEENTNGRRVIGHGGDTVLFHSLIALYLDSGVGLFMSFNSPGRSSAVNQVREQLFERFSDRYLPDIGRPDGRMDLATARAHAAMFTGAYASSRRNHSSFLAALQLLSPVRVTSYADGTIASPAFKDESGAPKRFRETSPFVWRQVGGHDRLAAIVADGRIARFSTDGFAPAMVFDAIPRWKSPMLLLSAFVVGLAALATTLLFWPIAALVRRRYGTAPPYLGTQARAQRVMRITAVLAMGAVAGWLWLLTEIARPTGIYLLSDHDGLLYLIEGLTIIGFVAAFLAASFNVVTFWRAPAPRLARLWSMILLLGTFALLYTGWIYRLMTISAQF